MANLLKGGKAVYKTTQATSAAVRAVDIYKTSQKSFDALKISQKGLYGLTATNGFSEAITGRDMFGNYTYTTDHYGRIVKVEASDLKYGEIKRNQYAQCNSGKPDRLLDDDGGHLIASIFKGSGDIDNLVPMNSQINRSGGKWYEMEQKWRKALASDPPKRVEVIIEPKYLNDSIRPSEFGVFYSIEGKEKYLIIENKIGG